MENRVKFGALRVYNVYRNDTLKQSLPFEQPIMKCKGANCENS